MKVIHKNAYTCHILNCCSVKWNLVICRRPKALIFFCPAASDKLCFPKMTPRFVLVKKLRICTQLLSAAFVFQRKTSSKRTVGDAETMPERLRSRRRHSTSETQPAISARGTKGCNSAASSAPAPLGQLRQESHFKRH